MIKYIADDLEISSDESYKENFDEEDSKIILKWGKIKIWLMFLAVQDFF